MECWFGLIKQLSVYVGITEHGNVETENEVYNISQFNYDCSIWTHHHNPRTVANNPAGEINLNMGITGPHITLGAACAAGNCGLAHGCQMLWLDQGLGEGKVESCFLMGSFHFKIQRVLEIGCANSVNARNATKLYLNSKRTNG